MIMKRAILTLICFFPTILFSYVGENNFRYYQVDKNIPNGKGPFYAVYIKNNDPCIFVDDITEKTTHRFCKMGNSGFDLEKDYPSIYPVEMRMSGSFHFYVAAPWNEQKCEIYLPRLRLTCKPTGK